MKLFANLECQMAEIQQMEKDELPRREDRATVSAFMNGKPPLTQEKANEMGIKVNTNNLFGYTDLAASKESTLALYTKPARLWQVNIDKAPPAQKCRYEQEVSNLLNRVVKRSRRLRTPYEGVSGDATLHGEGEFYFPDATCPIPRHLPLSKRLVPSDAAADPAELTHFAVATELTCRQICWHIRNESKSWNLAKLRQLKAKMFDSEGKEWNQDSRVMGAIDTLNPEELEYARQTQGDVDRAYRAKVPVYYFFQVDPDKEGRPLDIDILLKYDDHDTSILGKDATSIFSEDEFYPTVEDAIQPFFMDCILGGEAKWHRVKGQGHLNYSIAWNVEMLMCRLMQGAQESSQNWWQVDSSANREALEAILLKHNAIIPEGVSLIPTRQPLNFEGVLQVLSIFQQRAARNARQGFSNSDDGSNQKELQVQAMFRQNAITAQQSSRLSNWYEAKSSLGTKILSRFTNPYIETFDPWYSMVMEFQGELKRLKIPLYWVQPWNVNVTATRITGDGDDMKAKTSAAFFMQNITMYAPQAQQRIKRMVTGIMADDYELAEELVPIEDKPDGKQVREADGENNTCIVQGRPPELQDTDIDEIHADTHLKGLVAVLKQASQAGDESFTPPQLAGFTAIGAHLHSHIERMDSMGKKDISKKYMEALMEVARMGDKLKNNLMQKQRAEQQKGEPIDPAEQAKLELAHANLDLAHQKQKFAQYKFERTQGVKEQGHAVDTSVKLAQDARQEDAHRAGKAEQDARLALDVTSAAREAAEPAPAKV